MTRISKDIVLRLLYKELKDLRTTQLTEPDEAIDLEIKQTEIALAEVQALYSHDTMENLPATLARTSMPEIKFTSKDLDAIWKAIRNQIEVQLDTLDSTSEEWQYDAYADAEKVRIKLATYFSAIGHK